MYTIDPILLNGFNGESWIWFGSPASQYRHHIFDIEKLYVMWVLLNNLLSGQDIIFIISERPCVMRRPL